MLMLTMIKKRNAERLRMYVHYIHRTNNNSQDLMQNDIISLP